MLHFLSANPTDHTHNIYTHKKMSTINKLTSISFSNLLTAPLLPSWLLYISCEPDSSEEQLLTLEYFECTWRIPLPCTVGFELCVLFDSTSLLCVVTNLCFELRGSLCPVDGVVMCW